MNEELYRINQKSENKELIKFHLCGTTFPDKNYRINRPSSNIWCIEYIEEGSGTVIIDGDTFYPHAGDSYFLHARKDHFYYSNQDEPWKKHFINLSGKLVEHLAEGYGVSHVSYFEGLDLKSELMQIIEIAKAGDMDRTPEIIAILNSVFIKMYSSTQTGKSSLTIGTQMKDFLNTQLTSKFNINLLCNHVAKSESQTIRLFKRLFGITPYAYVLDKKIKFAQNLLIDTHLSVKQISVKLCFTDEYYFSAIFKKKTGYTPTEYRKNSNNLLQNTEKQS